MKRKIFRKRDNIKPYEYPELIGYKDAIRHSYWLHTEFSLTSDIQDFKVHINDQERKIITRTMLAISQIEVSVKSFWRDIYKRLPKPEIDDIGVTFAESEVRHKDAYSFLIEQLGLNKKFETLHEIPVMKERIKYLNSFLNDRNTNAWDFTLSLILFSIFTEHISLFSQFLIMMSFNKKRNLFKGLSNIIEATSKEEEIHGRFGIELSNIIIKEEEMKSKLFYEYISILSSKAMQAEYKMIDWIYGDYDLDIIPKETVKAYISNRFNKSLLKINFPFKTGIEPDKKLLESTEWFDMEIISLKEIDFFNKTSTDYSKGKKSVTAEDL